jgi:FAD synthetase
MAIAQRTDVDSKDVRAKAEELRSRKLISGSDRRLTLTAKGRRSINVVFIGGGFEIIHPGHINTIEQARKLGDVLIVVVARDSTIRKRKGREPVTSESDRVHLLSSLRNVDAAILGAKGDIYTMLQKVRPNVVALGYDQHHAESDILKEGKRRGISLQVIRLHSRQPKLKTSRILTET